jgi:hypothetical protein
MGLNLGRPRGLLALTILSCSALTTTAQTLTPTSLGFGNWVVQTTSTSKAVVLNHTTTAPLAISSISVSGDFGHTSTCPIASATLAAGGSCKILATFTPTALGVRSGTLTVSDNASNSPQTAQLSGTGVTPVGLSPSSLAFGNQLVNATSAAKVLTLQNNQTVPLAIAGSRLQAILPKPRTAHYLRTRWQRSLAARSLGPSRPPLLVPARGH